MSVKDKFSYQPKYTITWLCVPCNKICKQQLESSLLYIFVLFNTANPLVLSVTIYIAL